jgi:predicted GIY-YIG superfamily endonuclease
MYLVYKATSPSDKVYIGITNNFKRRLKEHGRSKYSFGKALRKYGKDTFKFEFEAYDTVEDALSREAELVNKDTLPFLYNQIVGGGMSNVLKNNNPMHRQEVKDKHPSLFTKENNPMNNEKSKRKMIESQKRKKVSIEGVEYEGVRQAARELGSYRQFVIHRLRSKNFKDWYYVD